MLKKKMNRKRKPCTRVHNHCQSLLSISSVLCSGCSCMLVSSQTHAHQMSIVSRFYWDIQHWISHFGSRKTVSFAVLWNEGFRNGRNNSGHGELGDQANTLVTMLVTCYVRHREVDFVLLRVVCPLGESFGPLGHSVGPLFDRDWRLLSQVQLETRACSWHPEKQQKQQSIDFDSDVEIDVGGETDIEVDIDVGIYT